MPNAAKREHAYGYRNHPAEVDDKTRALVALDPATGNEMWRQPIPRAADADEYTDISAEGAIRAGERVIVALADGRFLDVDPRACDPACAC